MARWMARASIFASPARYEPFGLAVLEAALSGCALVLGDIPSLREVWGRAAVYAPCDDPDALARAIQRLIDQDTARARLAFAAHARARSLSASVMASRYAAIYEALTTRGRLEPEGEDACA
jgi:glycosyltransferase involved in cell wall biosynthesis